MRSKSAAPPTTFISKYLEKWEAYSVYCKKCGHDWVACYDVNNTLNLECPNCHDIAGITKMSTLEI